MSSVTGVVASASCDVDFFPYSAAHGVLVGAVECHMMGCSLLSALV
jgi:hypothetical protein